MRGDAAPRVGESNHGRLRSTWVSFPLRVKRGRGSRRGCGAAPRPLPACPTAQLGRCGAGGGTADPGGHRIPREPSTHGSCGAEGLLPGESSPPDSRRSPLDGGGGARRFALGTRKTPFSRSRCAPRSPVGAGGSGGEALPGVRGRRRPVEPGGGEGGGPAGCENCYFSSISRNLCKCPGQDTSRPAGWGHGDNPAMEKSKLHLLTSSQIQITALAWRGEGSERSM